MLDEIDKPAFIEAWNKAIQDNNDHKLIEELRSAIKDLDWTESYSQDDEKALEQLVEALETLVNYNSSKPTKSIEKILNALKVLLELELNIQDLNLGKSNDRDTIAISAIKEIGNRLR